MSGGSRIRTHGELAPPAVFKTAALNHSAIPPKIVTTAFVATLVAIGEANKFATTNNRERGDRNEN